MKKELKPITTSSSGSAKPMTLMMIGRSDKSRPYISIFLGQLHTWIEDKDIRRLRDWCNEILESRQA